MRCENSYTLSDTLILASYRKYFTYVFKSRAISEKMFEHGKMEHFHWFRNSIKLSSQKSDSKIKTTMINFIFILFACLFQHIVSSSLTRLWTDWHVKNWVSEDVSLCLTLPCVPETSAVSSKRRHFTPRYSLQHDNKFSIGKSNEILITRSYLRAEYTRCHKMENSKFFFVFLLYYTTVWTKLDCCCLYC